MKVWSNPRSNLTKFTQSGVSKGCKKRVATSWSQVGRKKQEEAKSNPWARSEKASQSRSEQEAGKGLVQQEEASQVYLAYYPTSRIKNAQKLCLYNTFLFTFSGRHSEEKLGKLII